ncbi:MAG: nickel pincer cofactor biosynthesis protein LarC, partial [Euryarchaeota archaeon]|nr:nickel pincer cofactor biosynthesis protein LarC [Euryarchaeota archaeon]
SHIKEIMESVAPVTVNISRTSRKGIAATSVSVIPDTSTTRTYPEIVADIRSSELPDPIIEDAAAIFDRIASAESTIHNISKDQLHFHEIGQADAIADVVGACTAIHDLAPSAIFCTRIMAGTGFVKTAHGMFPVPAPATLEILCDSKLSWEYGSIKHELLTPTGAAILAHIAEPYISGCVATRTGYGAGKADLEIPNVLRAILCDDAPLLRDDVEVLETSVDDVTGEVLGNLIEELIAMGAYDVVVIPATMKKGRSGHLIQVIVKPGDSARIARRIVEETGSLGVRISPTKHRLIAERRMESVRITIDNREWEAAIKIATDSNSNILNISAEFEDAKRIAHETGMPVREVIRRIVDGAWKSQKQ